MNKAFLTALAVALAVAPLAMAHQPPGTPKNYCEDRSDWYVHDYGPPALGRPFLGPPVNGCMSSATESGAALYELHGEYAAGGAWILVESGRDQPSSNPDEGAGTLYCFGVEGHHPAFGPVSVDDISPLGTGAKFSVYADQVDITTLGKGCGDFESDVGTTFNAGIPSNCPCTVTFPPGLDGSYQVYVTGTQGHVIW